MVAPWLPLGALFAVVICAASSNSTSNSTEDFNKCEHGTFNNDTSGGGSCECDKHWRVAGFSDPWHKFLGTCSQFQCFSDSDCERRLSVPGAQCVVQGWNCDCGWQYATGLLNGYSTSGDDGGKCMGIFYLVSERITAFTLWLMANIWRPFVFVVLFALPFGEKKVRCRCHNPRVFQTFFGLWKLFFGPPFNCHGDCVITPRWRPWHLFHDFAWSIYFFDICLWAYLFVIVLYIMGVVLGSVVAVAIIIFGLVVICIVLCSEGGCGSCSDANCTLSDMCGAEGCTCYSAPYSPYQYDVFFFNGPDPQSNTRCCNCQCCQCCQRCWLCIPVAWVLVRFPSPPTNLWGGLFGFLILGTHQFNERRYDGRSRLINAFNFQGAADLHEDSRWRQMVHDFILSPAPSPAPVDTNIRPRPGYSIGASAPQQDAMSAPQKCIQIRNVTIQIQENAFQTSDLCHESTFGDYEKGECWICYSATSSTWDLWTGCGHLFCSRCSNEMLTRHMPCPLCRTVSSTVRRGCAAYQAPPALSSSRPSGPT
eukprot:TRINITY_DN62039_c0_g1_i1.p1 TRINITY_DN62039_c0_g1~~TRINITY_DN62039_c0_g1_i1.p1  ORF type:complete len:536 (-),score=29.94 TRINITY_DN62039_c0_g1_i1:28-1635(-)